MRWPAQRRRELVQDKVSPSGLTQAVSWVLRRSALCRVARVAARRAVVAGGARDAARDGGCGSVSSRHLIAWRQPRSAMPLARPRRVSVLNAQSAQLPRPNRPVPNVNRYVTEDRLWRIAEFGNVCSKQIGYARKTCLFILMILKH